MSPAVTMDCQLPVWPAGPLKATTHSPFAWPGKPTSVLCTGSEAPASAEMVLARTQQPSKFQAWPTKLSAAAAMNRASPGRASRRCNRGWVTTVALPI